MANELKVKENAELAIFADFEDDGFGDIGSTDLVIPRLTVLGDLSPQVKKGNAKYIAGAEIGDIVDAALGVVVAKGYIHPQNERTTVELIPISRHKEAIVWRPRTSGGGIESREPLTVPFEKYAEKIGAKQTDPKKYEFKTAEGNEVVEHWTFYFIDVERMLPVFMSFKKSSIKMIKPWFNLRMNRKMSNGKRVPLMATTVEVGSFLDSGNGNEWANYTIANKREIYELDNKDDFHPPVSPLPRPH